MSLAPIPSDTTARIFWWSAAINSTNMHGFNSAGEYVRLLPTEFIPNELWSDGALQLPELATNAYYDELNRLGLLEKAKEGTDEKAIHGGVGATETLEHFMHRFAASAGRVEFCVLAPHQDFASVSDALISDLAEGHVAILDIPCGSGSSVIALLTTITFLRSAKILPTLPLKITVVGGDCSTKALEISESMMNRLKPLLASYGVNLEWELIEWDATRADSTANLIDRWFEVSAGAFEYIVCIANFSGALIDAGIFDQFSPSLEQILGRLHDKKSALMWVEPMTKSVVKQFWPKLFDFFRKRIAWVIPANETPSAMSASYKMMNPLINIKFGTNVEVQRFARK
jgi:hypothetical protein